MRKLRSEESAVKSNGFKIIVSVLVAVIVVLGGLLAVKTFVLARDDQAAAAADKLTAENAIEDGMAFSEESLDEDAA